MELTPDQVLAAAEAEAEAAKLQSGTDVLAAPRARLNQQLRRVKLTVTVTGIVPRQLMRHSRTVPSTRLHRMIHQALMQMPRQSCGFVCSVNRGNQVPEGTARGDRRSAENRERGKPTSGDREKRDGRSNRDRGRGPKGSGGRGAPQRDRGGKSANWSAGGASDANNPFAALAALKQGKK